MKKYSIYWKAVYKGKVNTGIDSQRGNSVNDAIIRWKASHPQRAKRAYSVRAKIG